jgi:hypothetical protein
VIVKPKLYLITLTGLDVASEWCVAHDRLLDEFPEVRDVLATTIEGTLLIVYTGTADPDGWLDAMSRTVLYLRARSPHRAYQPAVRPGSS